MRTLRGGSQQTTTLLTTVGPNPHESVNELMTAQGYRGC